MDHIVYVDAKAKEMERLLDGAKTMIVRGAAGRKLPHGRVAQGDVLYFINNNGEGQVKARATIKNALSSDKLSADESQQLLAENQEKLQLTEAQSKRWAGKRYLVLVEVENTEALEAFTIDKSEYGNMDDWLPVENIDKVRL